ncbi:hypothetical protein [Ectobacillus panaciterrae]|uniref:hypothetical protein n=1 Tax=Ectobacillus panaciterrae TaxID=363872 RepID=UPI00040100E1|nr:hypothetical protein [Ectobacillus panaciterrae]
MRIIRDSFTGSNHTFDVLLCDRLESAAELYEEFQGKGVNIVIDSRIDEESEL